MEYCLCERCKVNNCIFAEKQHKEIAYLNETIKTCREAIKRRDMEFLTKDKEIAELRKALTKEEKR